MNTCICSGCSEFKLKNHSLQPKKRHTDLSILDGYGTVEEYAQRATKINQKFFCVSDHGMVAAVPQMVKWADRCSLTPIFACELYINPGHTSKEDVQAMDKEQKKAIRKSYHLLAIAFSDIGFKNLVQLSSWAWNNGFYYKPRVNYQVLEKYKEGLIFTSCCYNSEVGQAFDKGGADAADDMIRKYKSMFGENYYLEFMLLDFPKQKPYNKYIVEASSKFGLPIILTNDCHYCLQGDSKFQRYMLMIQKGTTVSSIEKQLQEDEKAEIFELQDSNLWMKSEEELNQKWFEMYQDVIPYEVFLQAKLNTVKIANKAKGVKIDRSIKLPRIPDAEDKFKEQLLIGFKQRKLHERFDRKVYEARLAEEFDLIRRKEFCSYFLIQKQIVDEARRVAPEIMGWGDGSNAVGPGRGSCVGSLACYCLRLTDVDPIKHNLLFSRFLSENRGGRSMKLKFTKPPLRRKSENTISVA